MSIIKTRLILPGLQTIVEKYQSLGKLVLRPGAAISRVHVNLTPHKDFNSSLIGSAWTRFTNASGKSELQEVAIEDFKKFQFNILAFGGIDFDTKFHMAALLKSIETLSLSHNIKCAAIYPHASRKERFEAAVKYNENKFFFPEYITKLTRELVLPRFLNDKGSITTPKVPLSLYSFSIGAREIMMLENSLRSIFKNDYECSDDTIKKLFSYLNANCIAYAFDYPNLPEPRFAKTIIFSVCDARVLVPEKLENKVICQSELYEVKLSCISIAATNLSPPTHLMLLGHNVVPWLIEGNKIDPTGHSLPHYIEAIKNIPELHEFLQISMEMSGSSGIDYSSSIEYITNIDLDV